MFTFASIPPRLRAIAILPAALLVTSVALFVSPAQAGVGIFVNTFQDELNSDGDCSLREAIQAANTNAPVDFCGGGNSKIADLITVPAGEYNLTIPPGSTGDDDTNQTGDLDVLGPTDFMVSGTGNAVVDGGASIDEGPQPLGDTPQSTCNAIGNEDVNPGNNSRVFHLQDAVAMERFTIRGGFVLSNTEQIRGGGILSTDSLTLTDSTVEDNFAIGVGGIDDEGDGFGGGISSGGSLTLTDSVLRRNTASGVTFGIGGGLESNGATTATRTNFNFNYACGQEFAEGGGIASGDTSTLTNVQIIGNRAESTGGDQSTNAYAMGGGLRIFPDDPGPTVDLANSLVAQNTASSFNGPALGGGIHNTNVLTVTTTTVRGNSAVGGFDGAEGGGIFNEASLDVARSTLSGNSADVFLIGRSQGHEPQGKGGSSSLGGAIAQYGEMNLTNSTVAENDSQVAGGIFASNSSDSALLHTTVAENEATEVGGGIAAGFANFFSLRATIIAHNTGGDCYEESKGSPFFSLGSNLDTDNSCNLNEATKDDKQGQDPFLGDLQDNGGPTETMALPSDSPAVDAVFPLQISSRAPQGGGGSQSCPPPQTDQRGVERPKDGDGEGAVRCDMGAYELKKAPAPAPEACPGFEPNDPRNQIIGTPKADVLKGTNGVDIICGFKGPDTLKGLDGNDIILGGEGKDTLLGGDGKDLMNGDEGDDEMDGEGGSDKVKGRLGDDDVRGGAGGDVVRGGVGDDDVFGDAADDQVFGGIGADDMFGNGGDDRMYGKPGADNMQGGNGNDRLRGGKSYDALDGGDDRDACHTQEGGGSRINCELGE